ncbi:MAG: NADH-quinone oxidoreductase subunit A [Myxococcota bacterium]|nr:NADH-quinone oxidoreductase subunit A [Myxococcota bacterium]
MAIQYLPVLLAVLAAVGFMGGMLFLNKKLGPRPVHAPIMNTPFECGSPLIQQENRRRVSVKFYLIAILFVMFDLETVLLYPWAVLHSELGLFGLVELIVFLISLVVGLIYVWRKGALEWQ